MLLRQSRTLLRHCCWCGRGLTVASLVQHRPRSVGSRRQQSIRNMSWFRFRFYISATSVSAVNDDSVIADDTYDVIRRLRAQPARDPRRGAVARSAALPGRRRRSRLSRSVRHGQLCQLRPLCQRLRHGVVRLLWDRL